MRVFIPALLFLSLFLAGCASQSKRADEPVAAVGGDQAGLIQTASVSYQTPGESTRVGGKAANEVCVPKVVDQRAALKDDCLNRIEHVPFEGKRYDASGRETRQLRSLCENTFLPRCRRKY